MTLGPQIKDHIDVGNARALVFPVSKDAHASTFVTLLDPVTRRPFVNIYIDSSRDNSAAGRQFSQDMVGRFVTHRSAHHLTPEYAAGIKRTLRDEFKADMTASNKYILDPTKRLGYIINPRLAYPDGYKEYQFDVLYEISDSSTTARTFRSVPSVVGSLDLQNASDDMNCALYRLNVIDAIGKLVESGFVDRMADALDDVSDFRSHVEGAIASELPKHLPMYFNADGSPRSQDELRAFHHNMRWELGGVAIKLLSEMGPPPAWDDDAK